MKKELGTLQERKEAVEKVKLITYMIIVINSHQNTTKQKLHFLENILFITVKQTAYGYRKAKITPIDCCRKYSCRAAAHKSQCLILKWYVTLSYFLSLLKS